MALMSSEPVKDDAAAGGEKMKALSKFGEGGNVPKEKQKQKKQAAKQVQTDAKWDAAVAALQALFKHIDNFRWDAGKLLCEVETKYGEDSFGKIAVKLGVDKRTLYNYALVWKTFGEAGAKDTTLTWAHYLAAAKTDDPQHWIAAATGLSSRELEQAIREANPSFEGQDDSYKVKVIKNEPDNKSFEVTSRHTVVFKNGAWSCDCEKWWFDKQHDCKHIKKAKDEIDWGKEQ
jgi:hypothetical protein